MVLPGQFQNNIVEKVLVFENCVVRTVGLFGRKQLRNFQQDLCDLLLFGCHVKGLTFSTCENAFVLKVKFERVDLQ